MTADRNVIRSLGTEPPILRAVGAHPRRLVHRGQRIVAAPQRDQDQGDGADDYRRAALEACCAILTDGKPDRTRRVLELLTERFDDWQKRGLTH